MRQRSSTATAYTQVSQNDQEAALTSRLLPDKASMRRRNLLLAALAIALLIYSATFFLQHLYADLFNLDPIPQGPVTKHLVIASFKKQNVEWMKQVPSSYEFALAAALTNQTDSANSWTPYRYFLDDPSPPNNLSVPRNLGREAMAYLTYIIDNYDELPDYMIFTHGHARSWHQVEPLPWKIRALNLTALSHENYISLHCEDSMGCEYQPYITLNNTNFEGEQMLPEFWADVFPDMPMPVYLSYKCCAQFAVTRRAVLANPRERYERLRAPLEKGLEYVTGETAWGKGPPVVDSFMIGTFYEKIWHILLSGQAELCPSPQYCRTNQFSNAILCAGGAELGFYDNAWEDVHCSSAFEGVPPDEEPDWTRWYKPYNMWHELARLHEDRRIAYQSRIDRAVDAERERDNVQRILKEKEDHIVELERHLKEPKG